MEVDYVGNNEREDGDLTIGYECIVLYVERKHARELLKVPPLGRGTAYSMPEKCINCNSPLICFTPISAKIACMLGKLLFSKLILKMH